MSSLNEDVDVRSAGSQSEHLLIIINLINYQVDVLIQLFDILGKLLEEYLFRRNAEDIFIDHI